MKFKPYPKYKASGVEWLGEVPSTWDAKPLKRMTSVNDDVLPESTDPDDEIDYVDISSVSLEEGIQTIESMKFKAAPSRARRRVRDGDVIVSTVRTYLKAIAPIKNPTNNLVVSTGFAVIRPRKDFHPDFARYSMQAGYFIEDVIARSTGISYPAINASELVSIKVAVPPVSEQCRIAAFLDRETTKLDTLIAKQEKLIELLQEKRQAMISHAVTKGLDPSVPMKDSGIEWLGKVPEHWDTRTIAKASTKITNGYVGPTRDILVESGTPYIQATHIKNGQIEFDGSYFVTPEWSKSHAKSILAKGNVLIVQTGAGTGDVGLVSGNEEGFNCHALIIVECLEKVLLGAFLAAFLQSEYGHQKLESIQTGGMHPHLNCGNVKYVEICFPPIPEQKFIIDYLSCETATIDALIDKSRQSIVLIQEHRTALISAAVTGKIDVREAA